MANLITIITINLNNHTGLKKTFTSVFRQTFTDFEYIIIDGASTDGSYELIKENSDKLSFWISEADSGVYEAMNKGIIHAKGTFLLFLNSGDYLTGDNVLEKVFEETYSADIILCGCNILQKEKIVHTLIPEHNITFGYLYFTGINHQSTFIRKSLFQKTGMYLQNFRYNGDIEFWLRAIIFNNASTISIPVIVTNYNLEGISSLNNTEQNFKAEIQKIYNNPLLEKFIPDYEKWKLEKEGMKILYWVKSKKTIYGFLKLVYNFARWSNKVKRLYRKQPS